MQTLRFFLSLTIASCCSASLLMAQIDYKAPRYSPEIDGIVTEAEMAGQLRSHLSWPEARETGGSAVIAANGIALDIEADIYTAWDDTNLYVSAVVFDTGPGHHRLASPGPYNGQDVLQPAFNPFNDPDNNFVVEPFVDTTEIGPAAIYDLVIDSLDENGPDIYRHGDVLTTLDLEDAGGPIWSIDGRQTFDGDGSVTGYMLEAALPWAIVMDIDPSYTPKAGDVHGYSYLILDVDDYEDGTMEGPSLIWDAGDDCCGEGTDTAANTIQVPTVWHTLTLVGSVAEPGDFNADGDLDMLDINMLVWESASQEDDPAFDLNDDGAVNSDDVTVWAVDLKNTYIGDANLDLEFNSGDFVAIFTAGKYDKEEDAVWTEGDWNGDHRFNSGDLVKAFTDGGYELGPKAALAAVPEPSSLVWLVAGALFVARYRRRS